MTRDGALVSVGDDRRALVFREDLSKPTPLGAARQDTVDFVTLAAADRIIVTAGRGGVHQFSWPSGDRIPLDAAWAASCSARALAASTKLGWAAVACDDGIWTWDPLRPDETAHRTTSSATVAALAPSASGTFLAANLDGTLTEITPGVPSAKRRHSSDRSLGFVLAESSEVAVCETTGGCWMVEGRWTGQSSAPHGGYVRDGALDPDRGLLATAGDHGVKLFQLGSAGPPAVLDGHGSYVTSVTFVPNRAMLATASADGTVRLWSTLTKRALAVLPTEEGSVLDFARTSPRGDRLAAGSDKSAAVWLWQLPEEVPPSETFADWGRARTGFELVDGRAVPRAVPVARGDAASATDAGIR